MDLLQLQYFRAIAEYENITKAAQALFVSQPNLSISLSRLESDLGVKLFERRKGKITLSPEGQVFLSHVSRALDELNFGVEKIRPEKGVGNHIRVAGSMTDFISDILLESYFENVRVKQMNCANRDICDRVLNEEVDFGFYFGEPKSKALEYKIIVESERVAVVCQDHPLAKHSRIPVSALAQESFICNHCRDDDDFLATLPRIGGFRPQICFECDDVQVEMTMVTAGKGISIAPAATFRKIFSSQPQLAITCVRFSEYIPPVQLGMVRRRGHRLSDAALSFFQHLEEVFHEDTRETIKLIDQICAAKMETGFIC